MLSSKRSKGQNRDLVRYDTVTIDETVEGIAQWVGDCLDEGVRELCFVTGPSSCSKFRAFFANHGIYSLLGPLCEIVAIVDDAGLPARVLRALRFVCHVWPMVRPRDLYCVRVYRSPWRFCRTAFGQIAVVRGRSGFLPKRAAICIASDTSEGLMFKQKTY